MKRLLLVSSSRTHGTGYLDHCADEMKDLLGRTERLLFIPHALHDRDAYAAMAKERFGRMGYEVDSLHEAADPRSAVDGAQAFFVGGGNTFRLLDCLYAMDVLAPIRQRVESGAPYMGASAGSNIACVSIKTTNDMPIVQPPSFDALGLVPFNINPHYLDPAPESTHQGETRETRIREFHEMNDTAVVGLREGSMLRVEGFHAHLKGNAGARIFEPGKEPREVPPGGLLDELLSPPRGSAV
jgi:dipeptidase E